MSNKNNPGGRSLKQQIEGQLYAGDRPINVKLATALIGTLTAPLVVDIADNIAISRGNKYTVTALLEWMTGDGLEIREDGRAYLPEEFWEYAQRRMDELKAEDDAEDQKRIEAKTKTVKTPTLVL